MRRAAVGIAAGATAVLLAGVAVLVLRGADTTTSYDEQAALDAFRAAPHPTSSASGRVEPTPSASPSPRPSATSARSAGAAAGVTSTGPTAPAPGPAPAAAGPAGRDPGPSGVYRYATEGHEEVDVLGGARHDYPAMTSITYSRTDCGGEERWQPLEERVGVTRTCPGADGDEVRATVQEREFFGQRQTEHYTCSPGALLLPTDPRPGQSWRGTCRSDDSTATLDGRVVGLEELAVGGDRVPVVRITIRGALSGSTRGSSDRELWLARSNGLLVQAVSTTDTDADTEAGTVRYRETYRLRLQSLTPAR